MEVHLINLKLQTHHFADEENQENNVLNALDICPRNRVFESHYDWNFFYKYDF